MLLYFLLISLFLILIYLRKFSKPSVTRSHSNSKPLFTTLKYTDTKSDRTDSFMLKSEKLKLRGKPDLVYKSIFTRKYFPIELKSGKLGNATVPRDGDLMQLVSYFFILEEYYNCKVPYGKLVYSDSVFIVRNTKYMRKSFLKVINDMRNFKVDKCNFEVNPKVCSSCSLKHTVCQFKK